LPTSLRTATRRLRGAEPPPPNGRPLPAQTWLRQPLHHGQRVYLNPRRLYFLRAGGTVEALFRAL